MGREWLERYGRCLLVQHGYHWGVEGEVSQPIEFHHHQSLDCWNEGPRIRASVEDPRMPSDNGHKGKRPRHALYRCSMHEGTQQSTM